MTQPPQPETRLTITRPDDVVAGHYADFVNVWHNQDVFVLDFAVVAAPPQPGEDDAGPFVELPARVVTRVRIPPAQVFEIMKALEQQLTAWERETTQRQPGGDDAPPG